eukprot:g2637.t1
MITYVFQWHFTPFPPPLILCETPSIFEICSSFLKLFQQSFFGFGPTASIDIILDGEQAKGRKKITLTDEVNKTTREVPIYEGVEDICGVVKASSSKPLEHIGIKIEFFGVINMMYDRGQKHEFTSLVRELAPPGQLFGTKTFPFEFKKVKKEYESYNGMNVQLRYFLRVTITRSYAANITKDADFWIQNLQDEPEINNSIKMEVGIEDCLHIEFEYNKSKYHLKDIVLGKIYFLLVRIKIKHMELAIVRRESAGTGTNVYNESETLTKYEIMDGAPVRGESIPVRLFLASFPISPTYRNINNKFSSKYFLNLVLVDNEDRRYFKQQEITLWRQEIG